MASPKQRIKLVQGDNRPSIRLTLKDNAGDPLNVSAATVRLYLREDESSQVVRTFVLVNDTNGTDGKVVLNFAGNALVLPEGNYSGEVEAEYAGGQKHTVYDLLRFFIRAQVG